MQFDTQNLNLPPVESPFFEEWLASKKEVPDNWAAWARDLNTKGYTVIKAAVDAKLIDDTLNSIESLYPGEPRVEPVRYQDLWKQYPGVKQVALQHEIFAFLNFAYAREPVPFQTLNFKFGTQQALHSDLLHFSCIPQRFMCGVWTAFEDLDADNGPLLYCEGSQNLPEYNYFDLNIPFNKPDYEFYSIYEDFIRKLIKARHMEPQELHIKKGDVMIWSANLLHGGKAITDLKRTRWSQVTHYYFEDCIYYTPMHSEASSGKLYVRDITNIATGKKVPNKIKGREISLLGDGKNRYWIIDNFNPAMYDSLAPEKRAAFVDEIVKREKKIPLFFRTLFNRFR
jgi:hypothetical protein